MHIEENSTLDHKTDISQKIDVLSFAIGLDFDVLKTSLFDVFISGGINNNFVWTSLIV
jgi:hypothetical protein